MNQTSFVRLSFTALFLLALSACSSYSPTAYRAGLTVDDEMSYFSGNSFTPKDTARVYSKLGAVEACRKRQLVAFLDEEIDQTTSRTYTQVYSTSYTTPAYTTYGGRTYTDYSRGTTTTNVGSYPVTDVYPTFATPYHCLPRFNAVPGIGHTETLQSDIVHRYTGDFRPALHITKGDADSGFAKALKEGDVVLKVNNQRVTDLSTFTLEQLPKIKKKTARFTVIRNRRVVDLTLPLIDGTEFLEEENAKVVASACEKIKDEPTRTEVCPDRPPQPYTRIEMERTAPY